MRSLVFVVVGYVCVLLTGSSEAEAQVPPRRRPARPRPVSKPQPIPVPIKTPLAQPAKTPSPAKSTRSFERTDQSGAHRFQVTLTAPKNLDTRALDYVEKTLTIATIDAETKADLRAWRGDKRKARAGAGEVIITLRALDGSRVEDFAALPSDGFELVRPGVIQLKEDLSSSMRRSKAKLDVTTSRSRKRKGGTPKSGVPEGLLGTLMCSSYDTKGSSARTARPLPFVSVTVGDEKVSTDEDGNFEIPGRYGAGVVDLEIKFAGKVRSHGSESEVKVMGDLHASRTTTKSVAASLVDGRMSVGTPTLTGVDCEIFRLGVKAIDDYHQLAGTSPPAGRLRLKRWSGVWSGTPYAYYDYVVLTTNFGRKDWYKDELVRRQTIFHEFGHTVRHVSDGSEAHWGWDNFRWAYARNHMGCETFNTQYAFNEGWAGYWGAVRAGDSPKLCYDADGDGKSDPDKARFMDWTEGMIGHELVSLHDAIPVARGSSATEINDQRARKMAEVLDHNPKKIHSLREFELRYCNLWFQGNSKCTRKGVPARPKPKSCPPGYNDDGATCRLKNILAKESYGRGVGKAPQGCRAGQENQAGLCYKSCRNGYKGVGPVCWQRCPTSFRDDGAYCAKPKSYGRGAGFPWKPGDPAFKLHKAKRRCEKKHGAGNCEKSGAIYYPKCRSGFHKVGCCVCSPNCTAGMKDIGVSCQKKSYGRGAGQVPQNCPAGMEKDAALCYKPCRSEFKGVGPVCWKKSCPEGYKDHGATCYRPPHILVKY